MSDYYQILEQMQCPNCSRTGMVSDGGFDWECPHCGYSGSFENEYPEECED